MLMNWYMCVYGLVQQIKSSSLFKSPSLSLQSTDNSFWVITHVYWWTAAVWHCSSLLFEGGIRYKPREKRRGRAHQGLSVTCLTLNWILSNPWFSDWGAWTCNIGITLGPVRNAIPRSLPIIPALCVNKCSGDSDACSSSKITALGGRGASEEFATGERRNPGQHQLQRPSLSTISYRLCCIFT